MLSAMIFPMSGCRCVLGGRCRGVLRHPRIAYQSVGDDDIPHLLDLVGLCVSALRRQVEDFGHVVVRDDVVAAPDSLDEAQVP